MQGEVVYRRAVPEDMPAAYLVFRRALYDYLFRQALVSEEEAKDPPLESAWKRQGPWIEHLWHTAAENWLALDALGRLLGWAMSTERDGHLELTHFFVDPERQGKGVGRGLIDRAFASHPAAQKSILATQDPAALSLYLRAGVGHVTTAVDILMRPQALEEASDLDFEALSPDAATTETLAVIEKAILGCRRDADLAFLLGQRPAWLARRNGRAVGFAFGLQPDSEVAEDFPPVAGPMAALSPDDVPALIDHVLADAVGKCDEFFLAVPFANRAAMTHTLARGGRIDPFYVNVLSNVVDMKLDRWIHTEPMFIL